MDITELLEALTTVYNEEKLSFISATKKPVMVNYLVGKMMVETKGKCDPNLARKLVMVIVDEL